MGAGVDHVTPHEGGVDRQGHDPVETRDDPTDRCGQAPQRFMHRWKRLDPLLPLSLDSALFGPIVSNRSGRAGLSVSPAVCEGSQF